MRLARRLMAAGVIACACLGITRASAAADDGAVVIFAAASLKEALDYATAAWTAESGHPVTISYAGTSALARQIEQGAPADIFISASLDWMDYLEERGLIQPATRIDLLGNRLALIAPGASTASVEIAPRFDLAAALDGGRLAIANTDAVPAGIYGKAALVSLGVWQSVENSLAQAQDVRGALMLVSRGEAPLGIVYASDAAADPNVRVVGLFPGETHPPIVYPIALVEGSKTRSASALIAFLTSPRAARFFEARGFTVLNPGG